MHVSISCCHKDGPYRLRSFKNRANGQRALENRETKGQTTPKASFEVAVTRLLEQISVHLIKCSNTRHFRSKKLCFYSLAHIPESNV